MIMRSLILQIFAIVSIQALENPIPSSLLQPRDFNPHPYQQDVRRYVIGYSDGENVGLEKKLFQRLTSRFRNTGPVRFPDDPSFARLQYQRREQQRQALSHIIDNQAVVNSPYEPQPLPITRRPPPQSRYTDTADQHQILAALANHAKRVQNNEFQRNTYSPTYTNNRIDDEDNHHHEEDDEFHASPTDYQKKEYNFAYSVKDIHSGDDFSHNQKQENGAVQGSYKVRLPDNRIQITKYIADEKGYRADVTYEEDGEPLHEIPQIQHEQQHLIPSQSIENYGHVQQKFNYYPQQQQPQHYVKPINQKPRFTATPTPYFNTEQYSHVRAPSIRKSYPSTTALPNNHRYY